MATIGQLSRARDVSFVILRRRAFQDAAKHMHAKRIGSLLVKKDSEFSGIVTETDVVQAVAEQPGEIGQLTVKGLMSSPIITVDRNMSPNYARDLMADQKSGIWRSPRTKKLWESFLFAISWRILKPYAKSLRPLKRNSHGQSRINDRSRAGDSVTMRVFLP